MRKTYVMQVLGGTEEHVAHVVNCMLPAQLGALCYVPRFERRKRIAGQWELVRELLTPGYVYTECTDANAMHEALRAVPRLTKLLGSDGVFVPLRQDELAWIDSLVRGEDHVVELSQGVMEGERVRVIDGPLIGREALITKIDRHKRLAYLDMQMFGRIKTVRVGLEVVCGESQEAPTGSR